MGSTAKVETDMHCGYSGRCFFDGDGFFATHSLAIERKMREMSSVGEQLTRAGFLLSQGLFDEAGGVMDTVPLVFPQSASLYFVLGDQYGRRGEWRAAISRL